MDEKVYTVSEAVRLIGVESHVLRYWEEELEIPIERTSQGHRVYSRQNVDMFRRVKELREEGFQLKAIRRVLDQAEGKIPGQPEFEEFCSDFQDYEIVPTGEPADGLEQFAAVLKQMLEEVVREQNEKLEQAMEACIQEKMEELYLQYFQMMQEAASSREKGKSREGILRRLLHHLLRR